MSAFTKNKCFCAGIIYYHVNLRPLRAKKHCIIPLTEFCIMLYQHMIYYFSKTFYKMNSYCLFHLLDFITLYVTFKTLVFICFHRNWCKRKKSESACHNSIFKIDQIFVQRTNTEESFYRGMQFLPFPF